MIDFLSDEDLKTLAEVKVRVANNYHPLSSKCPSCGSEANKPCYGNGPMLHSSHDRGVSALAKKDAEFLLSVVNRERKVTGGNSTVDIKQVDGLAETAATLTPGPWKVGRSGALCTEDGGPLTSADLNFAAKMRTEVPFLVNSVNHFRKVAKAFKDASKDAYRHRETELAMYKELYEQSEKENLRLLELNES